MVTQRQRCRFLSPIPVAAVLLLVACGQAAIKPTLQSAADVPPLDGKVVALKAHLKSGELLLLSQGWELADTGHTLRGIGQRYSMMRLPLDSGHLAVPVDSIVLIEADYRHAAYPFGLQALAAWTILYGITDVACLADPKSCFGSCPTFYLDGVPDSVPRAEGFSASFARALEATDVDALRESRPGGSRLSVTMRNEALETHAVRWVRLLAVPRPTGGRVFATPDGRFYPATAVTPPGTCSAREGDCLGAVSAIDGLERFSLADSTDLAVRETLEVSFTPPAGSLGVVVGARNSLLNTYVFYQTLASMGGSAGDWFARLEQAGPAGASLALGIDRLLGGIDVDVAEGAGPWRGIGSYHETGPIAGDLQVLPLEAWSSGAPIRIRLRMARGNWRLGYVAVARLGTPLTAVTLNPTAVERRGQPDQSALAALRHPNRYLVTGPGEAYRLRFELPAVEREYELFLQSRGYYYEWMRRDWLRDEDSTMVRLTLFRPAEALRRLARPYKQHEPFMERLFWLSRFGR